jgi:hypothetical protein
MSLDRIRQTPKTSQDAIFRQPYSLQRSRLLQLTGPQNVLAGIQAPFTRAVIQ